MNYYNEWIESEITAVFDLSTSEQEQLHDILSNETEQQIYNLVLDTETEKQKALEVFRELNINVVNIAGYYTGYYIEIETDKSPETIEQALINKGVI